MGVPSVGQNRSWQNTACHEERPPFVIALLFYSIIKSVRRFLMYITLELLINLMVRMVRYVRLLRWGRYVRLVRYMKLVRCVRLVRYVRWASPYVIVGYDITMTSSIWGAISVAQSCVFLISCLKRQFVHMGLCNDGRMFVFKSSRNPFVDILVVSGPG